MEQDDWNDRVAGVWADAPRHAASSVVKRIDALVDERPDDDPVALFEAASARDYADREADAEPLYRRALDYGLPDGLVSRARIQLASTLRNLGRPQEALDLLQSVPPTDPLADSARAFLALTLIDLGEPTLAARLAIETLAPHLPAYRTAIARYALAEDPPE